MTERTALRTSAKITTSLLLLFVATALSQNATFFGQNACFRPVGTNFTDTFGDSFINCNFGGYAGCDNQWAIGAGTGQIITSAPGSPITGVCAGTLKMPISAGGNNYIYTTDTGVLIPSGTTFDMFVTTYVSSHLLAGFDATNAYCASLDNACGQSPGIIKWRFDGVNFGIVGQGSTTSAQANLTLNAWHTLRMHIQAGAAGSYVSVDGGATQTFTANAFGTLYVLVGTTGGNLDAVTFYTGNLKIDSAVGGGPPPNAYEDFENSSDATNVTPTILTNATHSGNGTWGAAQGTSIVAASMKICNSGQQSLTSSVTTAGVTYTDSGSTRGFCYDASLTTSNYFPYNWTTLSSQAVTCWNETVTVATGDTGFYSHNSMTNGNGNDFASIMITSGEMYLEVGANPNGNPDTCSGTSCNANKKFSYAASTPYHVCIQYVAGTGKSHTLWIYNASGTLLTKQTKANAGTADLPNGFALGRIGDSGTTAGAGWKVDNVVFDYTRGLGPILF